MVSYFGTSASKRGALSPFKSLATLIITNPVVNSSVLLHKSFSKQKKNRLEKTNFEVTVTEILKTVKLQYLKIQIPVKAKIRLFLQTFRLTLILI